MDFKRPLVLCLLLMSHTSLSAVYKCTNSLGELSFTDNHCPSTQLEEHLNDDGTDWIASLKKSRPANVQITNVYRRKGVIFINYTFKKPKDSNRLMRLATKLSQRDVYLVNVKKSHHTSSGKIKIDMDNSNLKLNIAI